MVGDPTCSMKFFGWLCRPWRCQLSLGKYRWWIHPESHEYSGNLCVDRNRVADAGSIHGGDDPGPSAWPPS